MGKIVFDYNKFSRGKVIVFHMWESSHMVVETLTQLEIPYIEIECDSETLIEDFKKEAKNSCGIIITGGLIKDGHPIPALPDQILNYNLPKLGICLGHQLLGFHLGSKIEKCNLGEPIGETSEVFAELYDDEIFEGLPLPSSQIVKMEHFYMLDKVPGGAKLIASTKMTPIAGFHHKAKNIWGVQFHPEKDCIKNIVIKNFYKICLNKK